MAAVGDVQCGEDCLESIREYLRNAFPDWTVIDALDNGRDAHVFRISRPREPIHVLTVHRQVLEDHTPAELVRLLAERRVAQAMRDAPVHRVLLERD
jgi:hypothetical protein